MASEGIPRVLLDANVIFSGFQGTGPPSRLVELAGDNFEVIVTDEIINEAFRNLARKAPLSVVAAEAWFEAVEAQVWEASGAAVRRYEGEFGKDAHVVAAAMATEVDYVCTGDNRLRDGLNAMKDAPRAITPRELLDLLSAR